MSAGNPSIRTTVQLQGAVKDFCYLLDQAAAIYFWEVNLFPKITEKLGEQDEFHLIRNAILESSLLSIRVLNEFFTPGGRSDDVRSEQFPGYIGKAFLTNAEAEEFHKHLAHMTIIRAANTDKHWKIADLLGRAFVAAEHFLSYLKSTPTCIPPGFDLDERKGVCRYVGEAIRQGIKIG